MQSSVQKTKTQTSSNIPLDIEEVIPNKQRASTTRGQKKLHISTFLILVNSNVSEYNAEKANNIADCLKKGTADALKNHEKEVFFIKPPATDTWSRENILSIKTKITAEIGPKYKRLHVHALVKVIHTTLVQMNAEALRQHLLHYCKHEAITNLFVRIRFIPKPDLAAELYLEKNPI